MKRYAIIVAGGQGLRLGGEIPKQFLPLKGRPLLFYTLDKFQGIADQIILVLPSSHIQYWKEICTAANYEPGATLVPGGNTRAASVINGLLAISSPGLVAIHDAARPFVSPQLISKLYEESALHGSAIPVIPIRETMRMKRAASSQAVNREDFVTVQTPQCFEYKTIIEAYQHAGEQLFTDDSSVFEFAGKNVHMVTGETTNIKITYREDIAFAEALLDATKM